MDMGFPIDAVVAFASGWYGQQPITLVIADRFHIRRGKAGQFADFHLCLLTSNGSSRLEHDDRHTGQCDRAADKIPSGRHNAIDPP